MDKHVRSLSQPPLMARAVAAPLRAAGTKSRQAMRSLASTLFSPSTTTSAEPTPTASAKSVQFSPPQQQAPTRLAVGGVGCFSPVLRRGRDAQDEVALIPHKAAPMPKPSPPSPCATVFAEAPWPDHWQEAFEAYEETAENACKLKLPPDMLGSVMSIMTCKQAHKMALFMLKTGQAEHITWLACWLDLLDMVEAVREARTRDCTAELFVDFRQSVGGQTLEQANRLKVLQAAGVAVRLVSGINTKDPYAEAGRSVGPGQGLMHAKVLQVGPVVIVGSANWTTSSKSNEEMCLLVHLTDEGTTRMAHRYELLRRRSVPFTLQLQDRQSERRRLIDEKKRQKRLERSVSPSAPSTPRSRRSSRSVSSPPH